MQANGKQNHCFNRKFCGCVNIYSRILLSLFAARSIAHCVAANFCFMALAKCKRQERTVAAPFPTKILRLFAGTLNNYSSHTFATFRGKSIAHYTSHAKYRSLCRGLLSRNNEEVPSAPLTSITKAVERKGNNYIQSLAFYEKVW